MAHVEQLTGNVVVSASMSLDGFIAKDDNSIGRLFDWYQNGEVEFPAAPRRARTASAAITGQLPAATSLST